MNLWTVGCADPRLTAPARSPMDKPGKGSGAYIGAVRNMHRPVSDQPLLIGEESSKAGGNHCYEGEYGRRLVYPVFGFGFGAILSGIGFWLCWFTARHNEKFFLIGLPILFAGWLSLAFADITQSVVARFPLLTAHLLMFPDRLGIGT